jgi:porin
VAQNKMRFPTDANCVHADPDLIPAHARSFRSQSRRGIRISLTELCLSAALPLYLLLSGAARAAPPPISIPAPEDAQAAAGADGGFLNGLNRRSQLLGDLGGLRTALGRQGISLAIQETSEVLGNTTGGVHRSFEYDGLTQVVLQVNSQRAFGYYGGLLNVSGLQIHGRNLSADNLLSLQTASGIEADRSTRLWEVWYDQKFLDEDRLDIKIGQQSLDQEFMVSSNALYFVNTMFGWPMVPSADMPGGGPAYPLSALGIRASALPIDGVRVLAGVFSGSPVPTADGDPQLANGHGTSFVHNKGTLSIVEFQFFYPALGSMVMADEAPPLGWTYRVGAWYDTQPFGDQRLDENGLSLANPASSGVALSHHGDYSLYAVADRLVWRDSRDPNRTIGVFARVMGTPQKDRNLIDFSVNAGLVFHSPFIYRTDDTFGFGVSYARVSPVAANLDRDTIVYTGVSTPVRTGETIAELTYQYQLRPWIQLQPDLQYVFNPGGGIADPNDPARKVGNELVMGVRANITF